MNAIARIVGTVSFRIGAVFAISGILSLAISVIYGSSILAFIGLGLVFWSVLFLLLRPVKYVEGVLLSSAAISEYLTIDRIIRDLKCEGQGYFIPPYPKHTPIPEHLKALKDQVVFIPAEKDFNMPSIEEIVERRFLLKKTKGILVSPPGIGLLEQAQKQSRLDFSKMDPGQICDVLSRYTTENFSLAKTMEIKRSEDEVALKMSDFLYLSFYRPEENIASVSRLGCPIVSALACALAGATGRIVTIDKQVLAPDGLTLEVLYRLLSG